MVEYKREFRRFHKSIWGALALLLVSSFSIHNVAGSAYCSLLMESSTAVSSPPVILQEGTTGNSTIYANSTSAKVSVEPSEISVEDYVDNNTSNVDSSDPEDKGTHSNFPAQQYGPDSIYDTLTEENTGGEPYGFVWLGTPDEVALGSTYSSWVEDQDLSDDSVPSTATGVILAWVADTTTDYHAVARGAEDTNNYMSSSSYCEFEDETWRMQIVKLGSNKYIDTWRDSSTLRLYVMGYTVGTDPKYKTVPVDLGSLTSGSWQNMDVTSYVDDDTDGLILFVQSQYSSNGRFAVRAVGSSNDHASRGWEEYNIGSMVVKIDANDIFQYYVASTSAKIFLVAETKGSIDYLTTNFVDMSPTSTGWTTRDLDDYATVPTDASGCFLQHESTSGGFPPPDYLNIAREYGTSWTFPRYDVGGDQELTGGSGIDTNNRIEIYIENTEQDVYLHAISRYVDPTNYQLDLEVQWTNADYDETNEELAIYVDKGNNTHSLDATGGYMIIGDGNSDWGSTTGTISFWIKMDTAVQGRFWGQDGNMETRWGGVSGTNLVLDWGGTAAMTSAYSFSADTWYFVAIVWNENNDNLFLYVGDENNPPTLDANSLSGTWGSTTPPPTQNRFMNGLGGNEPVDGHGDDLRYWDTDRTLAEIQSDYNTELTGSETNLRSYFKLNNNFDDVGPDNNDGSGSGGYAFSSDVPFLSGAPTENIRVDFWNGTAWQNLFTDLTNGWNHVSVSSYLTSSNFTIRFNGGNENGDTTQDSWYIDATILNVWTNETTYDYVLQVVNQVAYDLTINLQVYESSNINRLLKTTISFHDGNSSDQIIVDYGAITQPEGPSYNLPGYATRYISMSNIKASTTGTSYLYVYLKIRVPNTTTYARYIITFKIT